MPLKVIMLPWEKLRCLDGSSIVLQRIHYRLMLYSLCLILVRLLCDHVSFIDFSDIIDNFLAIREESKEPSSAGSFKSYERINLNLEKTTNKPELGLKSLTPLLEQTKKQ